MSDPAPLAAHTVSPTKTCDWPHSPIHRLSTAGAYMVTAGIYQKLPLFGEGARLRALTESLLSLALRYGWRLQAWAVFANHYHFIAESAHPQSLRKFVQHLHTSSATQINQLDETPARKVWFQYWDSHITFPRSFYARLNYVHQNAVHHKLVRRASEYPWCSAAWFERTAPRSFFATVSDFRYDRLVVPDDY
jgi:putative transposase